MQPAQTPKSWWSRECATKSALMTGDTLISLRHMLEKVPILSVLCTTRPCTNFCSKWQDQRLLRKKQRHIREGLMRGHRDSCQGSATLYIFIKVLTEIYSFGNGHLGRINISKYRFDFISNKKRPVYTASPGKGSTAGQLAASRTNRMMTNKCFIWWLTDDCIREGLIRGYRDSCQGSATPFSPSLGAHEYL